MSYIYQKSAQVAYVRSKGEYPMDNEKKDFRLPDGQVVSVGNERFQSAEILFDPSIIGRSDEGVQHGIVNAINRCPIDTRSGLLYYVRICGGCTMIPHFADRLEQEIKRIINKNVDLKICAPPDRNFSVWSGASIFASLASFQEVSISKEMYNEYGPNAVHRKCLYMM